MSEEATGNENNNQPQPEPTEPNPNAEWRNSSAAQQAFAEINALKKQLADNDAAQKAAKEAAEAKQLEEQGKYKELAAKAEAKLKEAEASYAAEKRQLKLEAGFAGIENEFTRAGVIAKCPDDVEPDAYIAEMREKNADLWGTAEPAPRVGANGGRSGTGGSASLKDRLMRGDTEAQKEEFYRVLGGGKPTI